MELIERRQSGWRRKRRRRLEHISPVLSQRHCWSPLPCPKHRSRSPSQQNANTQPLCCEFTFWQLSLLLFFVSERKLSNLAAQLLGSRSSPREVATRAKERPCSHSSIHKEAVSLVKPDGLLASQWVHTMGSHSGSTQCSISTCSTSLGGVPCEKGNITHL